MTRENLFFSSDSEIDGVPRPRDSSAQGQRRDSLSATT
jgi:hypothetical protein